MQIKSNKQTSLSISSYENLISAESMPISESPNRKRSPSLNQRANNFKQINLSHSNANHKNAAGNSKPSQFSQLLTPPKKISHELYNSVISPEKTPNSIKSFKYMKKPKSKKRGPKSKPQAPEKNTQEIFTKFRKLFSNFELKTQTMAKDFENLSKELMKRMRLFNESKTRFQKSSETSQQIELTIDRNHQRIQRLSDAVKWAKQKDFTQKVHRQTLRRKLGADKEWLPFKTKKQVLKENLDLFKGFYQKKQIYIER